MRITCRADIALRSKHRLDGCSNLGRRLRSLRWSPRVAWRACPVGPLRVVRRPRPPPRGPCAVPHLIGNGVNLKTRSTVLIVSFFVNVVVRLWFEREEH